MNSKPEGNSDERLAIAKDLLKALKEGDEKSADEFIGQLAQSSHNEMFQEVGKITRRLHNSMVEFGLDSKITALADVDIPDAKERLNYVITMTEQAAHSTLSVVEELLPEADALHKRAGELNQQWARFRQREMPYEEFREVSSEISDFFEYSFNESEKITRQLNEVLMVQGYQDITGQIIRRVINLVQEIENNMVELIRLSGETGEKGKSSKGIDNPELAGPVVPKLATNDSVQSQDDVDDLLSSLGF